MGTVEPGFTPAFWSLLAALAEVGGGLLLAGLSRYSLDERLSGNRQT